MPIHGSRVFAVRIHVLYFAVFRERLGREDEMLELSAGATVADAIAALAARHDAVARLRGRFRVAVDPRAPSSR